MVSKFLEPRRWDLITYRHEKEVYVKRLIGMPGESVRIDLDGTVWINGKTAGSPPDLPGKKYEWPDTREGLWIRPAETKKLGADEYFVVGDHSTASMDSRFEVHGTVKREEVVGVVSWLYWPLGRMRIVR